MPQASQPIRKLKAGCRLPYSFLIGQETNPLVTRGPGGQREVFLISLPVTEKNLSIDTDMSICIGPP